MTFTHKTGHKREMAKNRMRLDEILLDRQLVESRSQAKALIMSGKVRHGTSILDKAGKEYPGDIEIQVESSRQYVSRGAEKLAGYFRQFPHPVEQLRVLDIGASTGGFTDYLLQSGASEATCVDVGHGQLHYKLRTDPRVINLEKVNARHLQASELPHAEYPVIVMDLSFISLKLILPVAWRFLSEGGLLVSLIKPQFEAGKEEADRCKGVISDPEIRQRILRDMLQFAERELQGSQLVGTCESPITGANGNLEYLAGWIKTPIRQP